MKKTIFFSLTFISLMTASLSACQKENQNNQNIVDNQALTISISANNIDLNKLAHPCTIDGAKLAGLQAGQANSKTNTDYAADNKCSLESVKLNNTYQEYYKKGQQLAALGIKIN